MQSLRELEAVYNHLVAEGSDYSEALREGLDHLRSELEDQHDRKASLEQQVMDLAKEADEERRIRRKIVPLYVMFDETDPAA